MTEVLVGALGPLAAAAGSWVLMKRTYRRAPGRLTAVMIGAFVGKMLFFAAYVVAAVGVLALRPVPFVVSFTVCFIGFHMIEALGLRRLLAGGPGRA